MLRAAVHISGALKIRFEQTQSISGKKHPYDKPFQCVYFKATLSSVRYFPAFITRTTAKLYLHDNGM
jgi:hypothetical protein